MQIGAAFAVLAAADIFYQWWDYERQIRDVQTGDQGGVQADRGRSENQGKDQGDPAENGSVQNDAAGAKGGRGDPEPHPFRGGSRYQPDRDPAPIVLAKGQDELAARIVRTAEEHKVAVVENVPLARALYASTDLNQVIPPELYNAVAEVLVYLYRMDQKIP